MDDKTFEPEQYDVNASMEVFQNTMDEFLSAASVDTVFGKPIEKGDQLILPTAEVLAALGIGLGGGGGEGAADERNTGRGHGFGGGGGGRVLARPVAVIIASSEGVAFKPIVDVTKIALAALTAGAFMLGMVFRLMRGPKEIKNIAKGDWE